MHYKTKRDKVYYILMDSDKQKWTVREIVEALDEDVSERTVRNVFKCLVDENHMEHKHSSPYWFLN